MRPCSRCRRHVRLSEACCPFCGARLVDGTAPAAWAIGLAMLGAACGPGKPQETAGESSGAVGSSSGAPDGTSTTGSAPTTSATTQEPTTENSSGCASASCGGSSEGGAFIYGAPDGGSGTKDCDPWVQDCPEGQKCMPLSSDGDGAWDSLECVPVTPDPDQTGEPCEVEGSIFSGIDSCDVGSMCWHVDPVTLEGICVAQCGGSPDDPQCDDPDAACLINGDGTLNLCINRCDPLLQDCSETKVCIPAANDPNSFFCAPDESGAGGQAFDPCDKANACDEGLACVSSTLAAECDAMKDGCCLPFCDVTTPECPGAGQQCIPWFEEGQAPPGLENVGICGIPQ